MGGGGGKDIQGRVSSVSKDPEEGRSAAHIEGAQGRPEAQKQEQGSS